MMTNKMAVCILDAYIRDLMRNLPTFLRLGKSSCGLFMFGYDSYRVHKEYPKTTTKQADTPTILSGRHLPQHSTGPVSSVTNQTDRKRFPQVLRPDRNSSIFRVRRGPLYRTLTMPQPPTSILSLSSLSLFAACPHRSLHPNSGGRLHHSFHRGSWSLIPVTSRSPC